MRTIIFFIFLLVATGCNKNNSPDSGLNLDAESIAKAEKHSNEQALLASLKDIELFHAQNKTGLALNAPAEHKDIKEAEAVFGCVPPKELQTLWRWHNGESTDKFIWYHKFLSIKDSISQYKSLNLFGIFSWKKNWIPVFEFQGEWYGVQCGDTTPKASPVIFYFTESGVAVAYTNLTTYMQVMAQSMNNGGLTWKSDWWVDNTKTVSRIHAELNPGIKFPYHVDR